jgi:hypothetical protein
MSQTPQDDSGYGSTGRHEEPASPYHLQENQEEQQNQAESSLDDEYEMSLTELLYSSSSYHAIVKPGTNDAAAVTVVRSLLQLSR